MAARALAGVLLLAAASVFGPAGSARRDTPPAGLLIRNGLLVDGTGSAPRSADLRVAGDAIAEIGPSLPPRAGERVIDARGEAVAPGFIDLHSGADRDLEEMPDLAAEIAEGVTTAVVGQDGRSDLPVSTFYDRVERLRPGIDLATMVGHGTVRGLILGDDYRRAATPEEIGMMKIVVDRAMHDGAIGLSSDLADDPGSYATAPELAALASVAARYGGLYSSGMPAGHGGTYNAWRAAIDVGRRNQMPVLIADRAGAEAAPGRAVRQLALLQDAASAGLRAMAAWYPRADDATALLKSPLTIVASDPSVREPYGDGPFARVLGIDVHDRRAIPLAEAIAKMTSRPAELAGLSDRGILAAGRKADIVVFDPAAIGARGPGSAQGPMGISYAIVNGQVVMDDGRPTGARSGRPVRRERPVS